MVKDFLGLSKEDYLEYLNVATKDLKKARAFFSPMTTAPKMIRVLDKLYEKVRTYNIGIDENLFDYSIVLGVHSQLNVMPEYLWNKFLEVYRERSY